MKTILIDLDGVLNQYNGDFNPQYIPPIRKGAKQFIKKISKNFKLILFTSRNKLNATKWLIENNLDNYFADVTNIKEPCYLIIDDRCIKFSGDYQELNNNIKNYKL